MESLTSLINSLKQGEVKLVKHFYSLKGNSDHKKRDKLFNLVINKKATTDKEAIKALYGSESQSAFSQLKTRLKSDILNVLLLQDSSVKYNTQYAQAIFDCRRAIMQGEILLSRGVYKEAANILTKASRMAETYELYAEQITINDLLRNHLVMKEGKKPFEECSKSINRNIALLEKSLDVKYWHYEITIPNLFKTNNEAYYIEKGKEILKNIKVVLDKTKSIRVEFHYHLTALYYYYYLRKFTLALNHATQLLGLVEKNKVVNSQANLAGVNMEIANILINLERYSEAAKHAKRSLQYFKTGMLNELYSLEKLFFAYFRNRSLKNAQQVLEQGLNHKQLKNSDFLSAKWQFFKAAMEFENGNFDRSLKALRQNTALTKDKSGWLLGYCVLEIMNMIEKGKFDWVDYRFESFKKIIQRHHSKNNPNKRAVIILKILKTLARNNYCFLTTMKMENTNLSLLDKGKGQFYWNPAGYEIIRFEKWVKSNAKDKQLALSFS